MKEELTRLIHQALDSLVAQGLLPADVAPQVQIDRTRDKSHGDLASNIALALAKPAQRQAARAGDPDLRCPAEQPTGDAHRNRRPRIYQFLPVR